MNIIRKAIVVDNNDEDKKDRLKLKILPELKDVDDELLPWVLPKNGYGNTDSVNRHIPENDSVITVYLDDEFNIRNMRWDIDSDIQNNIDYDSIETNVNNITDKASTYTYPQPNEYRKFKDGSYCFRNTETGEFVFCHNSGVYTIYDEDGNVTSYTKDKYFRVYNDKLNFKLDSNGDLLFENEELTIEAENIGNFKVSNSNGEVSVPISGDVIVKGVSGTTINTDALIAIKNTSKNLKAEMEKLWSAVISINTNLQTWVSTNAAVGSPVTPNPATIALFSADNLQANLSKTEIALLLK